MSKFSLSQFDDLRFMTYLKPFTNVFMSDRGLIINGKFYDLKKGSCYDMFGFDDNINVLQQLEMPNSQRLVFRLKIKPDDYRCIAIKKSPESRNFGGINRVAMNHVTHLLFVGEDKVLVRSHLDYGAKCYWTMMDLQGKILEMPVTLEKLLD